MSLLFFLLASFSCLGYSLDIQKEYGEWSRFMMSREATSLEFRHKNKSDTVVLWNRTNRTITQSSRRKIIGNFYLMYDLTQEDNGEYITRDKNGLVLDTFNIVVIENTRFYKRESGKSIRMSFNLDPQFCNIYFFSESKMSMTKMVQNGTLTGDVYYSGCSYIELKQPCAIYNSYLESTCKGQFEFRDQNNNKALVVTLDIEPGKLNLSPIGITLGVLSILSGCCGCLKYCCCGSSSSEKQEEETPENEPAVQYNEFDSEPVRIKMEDSAPDGHGSTHPSSSETGPLMQSPPSVAIKSAQVPVSDQRAIHGPSSIISEPRFSLKGMSFPSALNSGSSSHDVYTSDKLNFR
ncbi:uncharacterized protein LOC130531933 isoform X1 [Takifugu flavidus]|uniref:uncharacterized protein LOC130531933 isoform X1 n=1 Tax=Takifugu flavidus TaxID=433684 RepID=UPI0025445854|nr:uncharacterized protein LOC130531933 isoform X1 [Takifugu flavidus]